jgi:hypothetical protein
MHNSNTESGLTTDLITSPKHSTTLSSSTSSSSSSSSTLSTLTLSNNNRNNKSKLTKPLTQQQQLRSKQQQQRSTRQSRQSPTARVYSNHHHHNRRPSSNNNNQRHRDNIYIDYENDSPFLVPAQLAPKPKNNNSNRSRSNNRSLNLGASAPPPLLLLGNDDLNTIQQRQPSLTSSITSSLGFGASLMEVIESTRPRNEIAIVPTTNTINNETVNNNEQTPVPSYYLDEKPPSYDVAVGAYQSLDYYNRL